MLGVSIVARPGLPGSRVWSSRRPETIRRQLVEAIRAFRPQVVVTFDPNGSNLHPDHVAISRFAGDAVAAAGDARWFPELGPAWIVQRMVWTLPVRPWVLLRMTDPSAVPGVDFMVDVSPWAATKAAAVRAHRTQHLNLERIFFSQTGFGAPARHGVVPPGLGTGAGRPAGWLTCSRGSTPETSGPRVRRNIRLGSVGLGERLDTRSVP